AEHISAYARRYYEKAGLSRYRDAPFDFNYALSETAFGNSQQQVSDPRHYVEFDPGEIWILNSAVTAHQVRYGMLLALNCLEFPYEDYEDFSGALPAIVAKAHREQAERSFSTEERA